MTAEPRLPNEPDNFFLQVLESQAITYLQERCNYGYELIEAIQTQVTTEIPCFRKRGKRRSDERPTHYLAKAGTTQRLGPYMGEQTWETLNGIWVTPIKLIVRASTGEQILDDRFYLRTAAPADEPNPSKAKAARESAEEYLRKAVDEDRVEAAYLERGSAYMVTFQLNEWEYPVTPASPEEEDALRCLFEAKQIRDAVAQGDIYGAITAAWWFGHRTADFAHTQPVRTRSQNRNKALQEVIVTRLHKMSTRAMTNHLLNNEKYRYLTLSAKGEQLTFGSLKRLISQLRKEGGT